MPKYKHIVICADGTWNTPYQQESGIVSPSNVVKLARGVSPISRENHHQIVYYSYGVGTGEGFDRLTGGALGKGLDDNIQDAYKFIIHNYEPKDRLFLFGFSRGAYTVRSLAGLIRNCGLLYKKHMARIPEAMDLYRGRAKDSHPNSRRAKDFRDKYCRELNAHFIGVWDTVGSLGIPMFNLNRRYQFHDVELSSHVKYAYHALAIDERRQPFEPTLWRQQPHARGQVMEQVWFPGVHSNVGGGYRETELSDTALHWMVRKAEACGLTIDQQAMDKPAVAYPNKQGKGTVRNSRTGFFRAVRTHWRDIGSLERGNEAIHLSAVARYKRDNKYRPQNLRSVIDDGVATTDE